MKTLVIYPGTETGTVDSLYYLLDPETGQCLATHLCSNYLYAIGDLHDDRPDRLKDWKERYGEDTEAKFIDETDYDWHDIFMKNKEFR